MRKEEDRNLSVTFFWPKVLLEQWPWQLQLTDTGDFLGFTAVYSCLVVILVHLHWTYQFSLSLVIITVCFQLSIYSSLTMEALWTLTVNEDLSGFHQLKQKAEFTFTRDISRMSICSSSRRTTTSFLSLLVFTGWFSHE